VDDKTFLEGKMQKFVLIIFALLLLAGCSGGDAQKIADMKILNIDDLVKDYRASVADARTKYEGKEFVVLGIAGRPLGENPLESEDTKHFYYNVDATNTLGLNCMIPKGDRAQFDNIEKGATIAVKGMIHINDGSIEMKPCKRDFRETKK
jgi:hypothetical protein